MGCGLGWEHGNVGWDLWMEEGRISGIRKDHKNKCA